MNNFGTNQNNSKDNKASVNTRSFTFANRDGFEPSAVNFGFWDDKITIAINPALEPSKQTTERFYDYEKTVKTSLTFEKSMALLYKLNKEIIPAMENGEDKTIGLAVGNDGMIAVGTGKKITNEIRPFIALFKGINPDTKQAELSIYYEFKRIESIDNYDPETGKYEMGSKTHAEFLVFIEFLKAAIVGMSNATTHATRTVNKYMNDRLYDAVVSIGEKVGANVTPRGGSSYRNGFNTNKPNWGGTSSSMDTPMTDTIDLNSYDQMDEYLN